jgi:hypothetical protein
LGRIDHGLGWFDALGVFIFLLNSGWHFILALLCRLFLALYLFDMWSLFFRLRLVLFVDYGVRHGDVYFFIAMGCFFLPADFVQKELLRVIDRPWGLGLMGRLI